MYRELEYQLGGSSNSWDDLVNFVNENKVIILLVVVVLLLLFQSNTKEGFMSYDNIKELFVWNKNNKDLTYEIEDNKEDDN